MISIVRILSTVTLTTAVIFLAGCESTKKIAQKVGNTLDNLDPIYRPDIVQGNFVSAEQMAALRIGMTREQVKLTLGTPLLTDTFHADRWDYIFTLTKENKGTQTKRLAVFFKGDSLDRIDGDIMPSESDFVRTLDSGRKIEKIPPLRANEKQLQTFERENSKNNAKQINPGERNTSNAPSTQAPLVFEKIYPSLEKN